MTLKELGSKHSILILGYGKEGKATEAFLRKHLPTVRVEHTDRKENPEYLNRQKEFDCVIKTPGIPGRLVTVPYTTATNIFFANLPHYAPTSTTIGVTGSKGKSTTSSLLASIAQAAGRKVRLLGNIGHPMLAAFLEPIEPGTLFVLELSSYQLEDIKYTPNISVFLNFFPEHLDYHGDLDRYFSAKAQMLSHARSGDVFVYNPSNKRISTLASQTHARAVPFVSSLPFSLDGMLLEGEHNAENIRACVTVAQELGIAMETAHQAILLFHPLPHRLQFVGEYKGIRFYDDAIATAPEPTIAAIDTLKDVDTLFLGGTDRGLDFTEFGTYLAGTKVRNLVLFPDTGEKMWNAIPDNAKERYTVLRTSEMKEAVRFAYERTEQGKICLLSCASPSYTLWENFEEKGHEFAKLVREQGYIS